MRKRRVVGIIYGMKYSRKDRKDRNRYRNGIKRNGQARLVYVKALTATSPARAGEPARTQNDISLKLVDTPNVMPSANAVISVKVH